MYQSSLAFQEHFTVSMAETALKVKGIPGEWGKGGAYYPDSHLVNEGVQEVVN